MIKAGIVCSEKRDYTPCHKGCTYTGEKSLAPLSSLWWITWTSPGAYYTLIGAILACFPRISTVAQSCIKP